MSVLQRSGNLIRYLLQVFDLHRAERILFHAARIQCSPNPIARNQRHAANRPDSEREHGFRQRITRFSQIFCRKECDFSRLDRPRRERLLDCNCGSVVNVRLPLLSFSKPVQVLAVLIQ